MARAPDVEPGWSYPHVVPLTPRVVEPPSWSPPSTNGDPAQTPEISAAVRPSADQTTEGRTEPSTEYENLLSIWNLLSETSDSAADMSGHGNADQSDKIIRRATDMIIGQIEDIGSVAIRGFRDLAKECQKRRDAESELADERQSRRVAESQVANYRSRVRCVMCLEEERSVLLQPCWHLVSCKSCADKVGICPVCRTQIEGRLKVKLT